MLILRYTEKVNDKAETRNQYFDNFGDATNFISSHPEFTDFTEIRSQDGIIGIDLKKTKKRVQNARLKALFADKSFEEELEAPSTWTYKEKSWAPPKKEVVYSQTRWTAPDYPLSVTTAPDGTKYDDETVERNIKAYEDACINERDNKVVLKVKEITDDGAEEIASRLLDCTPDYWGDTADKAKKGPTVNTLNLYFNDTTGFDYRYEDITYTGTETPLPYRITGWNIKMILEALSVYKFKPFWCQAGDKLIQMAPIIPAFTEAQAKRILKKRLYQGSSVVMDGEVFCKPGMMESFTKDFPYNEFSLEKGLGLKFTKLPDVDSLEIASIEKGADIKDFFIAPFCRSRKTLVFKDETKKEFIEHPDLTGEENHQIDCSMHCDSIPAKMSYRGINTAFVHLFAEELGLIANTEDYYLSRYAVCEPPLVKGETKKEQTERLEKERSARLKRIEEKIAKEKAEEEARNARIAAEKARIAKEKAEREAKEKALREDNSRKQILASNAKADSTLTVSKECYRETLERYISDHEPGMVPIVKGENSRLYEYFFDNRNNEKLMNKYPESWTLAALYFFYKIDLKCYKAAEDPNQRTPVYTNEYSMYVKRAETFIRDNNISYDDFCWFMSSLTAIFNDSLPLEDRKRRRLKFDERWIKFLPDSAYHFMHFFLLNGDRPELSSFVDKCGLAWVRYYNIVHPIGDDHNKKLQKKNVSDDIEYMKYLLIRCVFPVDASKAMKKDFYKETSIRVHKGFVLKGKMFVEGFVPVTETKNGKDSVTWKESLFDFMINRQKTLVLPYSKIRGLVNILNNSVFSFLAVFDTLKKKVELDETALSQSIIDLYKQNVKEKKLEFSKIVIPSGEMTYKDFKTAYPKFVELCNVTYDSGEYDGKGSFMKWSMRALGYTSPTCASWRKLLKDNKSIYDIKEKARKLRTASRIRWGSAAVIIAAVITCLASVY